VRRADLRGEELEIRRPLIDIAHRSVGDHAKRAEP
jgi:hypothetical protein